jgi:catechol 2,3-dioxygenase-like lactoylglutathione lyase family enzyme
MSLFRKRYTPNPDGNTLMKVFRITIEVADLDAASELYRELLGTAGKRHPGARHYFDCGGVIVSLLDPSQGGMKPTPGPKSLYFAVDNIEAVHARAKKLNVLAPFAVHGKAGAEVIERPWGEVSFYATDPWGNELCFVQEGTLYT